MAAACVNLCASRQAKDRTEGNFCVQLFGCRAAQRWGFGDKINYRRP